MAVTLMFCLQQRDTKILFERGFLDGTLIRQIISYLLEPLQDTSRTWTKKPLWKVRSGFRGSVSIANKLSLCGATKSLLTQPKPTDFVVRPWVV